MVLQATDSNFNELKSEGVGIIDFYSTHCGPCKVLLPVLLKIESEMQASNEYAIDPLLSRNYLCKMASKAGGIGSDALEAMPARDFNQITNAARNFLINSSED